MRISMIVPVYNEEAVIGAFLEGLQSVREREEIIFADGGSTDRTRELIGPAYRFLECEKGRAKQMNAAAAKAHGDVLWFVHCDSILPENGCALIEKSASGGAQWGCFHIRFYPGSGWMRCNAVMSDLRVMLRGVVFGDQGIFIRKDLFQRLGGFPPLPIMEDYEFSLRLRRMGIPPKMLPAVIGSSSRRYAGKHPLVTMAQMHYLRHLYRKGVDIKEIAKRYRDIR